MSQRRVIAHFMHEQERDAAEQMLSECESTDSYVMGTVDESRIQELRNRGLIVEELEEEDPAPPIHHMLAAPARRAVAGAAEVDLPPLDPSKPNYYLVHLQGPLLEDWRNALGQANVSLAECVGGNRYTSFLSPDQVSSVRQMKFVQSVRLYDTRDAAPVLPETRSQPPPGQPLMTPLDVRLHDPEGRAGLETWLEENNVPIAGSKGRKIRIYLSPDSPIKSQINARPEVHSIAEYVPPKLHNDRARALIGIDRANPRVANLSQTGRDQIVGVADTGIDESHPDFQGRVVGVVALGRTNDPSDPNGHGTHVAGSVLGDGKESNGQIVGAAPEAQLFFQSIMDANGELGGLPWDLNDLFDEAYQNGVRIHNNSWGAATASRYTFNSIEADEFVHGHRDMLVVISAGNEGTSADRKNSLEGFVDWLSVGSPASSKNAITVGASRSDRTSGGYSALTYNGAWPADFPDAPIADENVSGDADGLAAFSSRGPCDDRRIKPDVVAPGTDIVSAKSSRAPLRNFWGSYPGHGGRYAYMGGTSMAAPIVAGCAALVRQYFVADRGHNPSAALLKGTLVNSTRWLPQQDAVADFPQLPNFHQGFGCIYMPWAIPNESEADLDLEFLDPWEDAQEHFTYTGERRRYLVTAKDDRELRFCLTWTDLPARALQNNLNLFVQHLPSGDKWVGNAERPMSLNIPDPENNVEVIRIEAPEAGDYLIQITATNLLGAVQDFALVVTGALDSPITGH